MKTQLYIGINKKKSVHILKFSRHKCKFIQNKSINIQTEVL